MARKAGARCFKCSRSEPTQDIRVIRINPTGYDEPTARLECMRCGHTWSALSGFEDLPGYAEAKRAFDDNADRRNDSWLWSSRR